MLPNSGAGPEPKQPAHVLLVEDEVMIRSILAEEIRGCNLRVIEASTADEAWAYLSAGGQANVVVSDIHMPGTMNGLELARRIRLTYPEMKVIITSGNAGLNNLDGIAAFLPKPYRIGHAVNVVLENIQH